MTCQDLIYLQFRREDQIRSYLSHTLHIYRSLRSWTFSTQGLREFYLPAWLAVYRCTCHWLKGFNMSWKEDFLNCTLRVIQSPQKYLSTHLFICLHFIYLFTPLFMHLFVFLFTPLFIHLFACLFVYLHILLYLHIYLCI